MRWTSSPSPPWGGYGPSFVNPRTGEILGADIMLEWTYITNRIRSDELFNNPMNLATDQCCNAAHYQNIETSFRNKLHQVYEFVRGNGERTCKTVII